MIDKALKFLLDEVNSFLNIKLKGSVTPSGAMTLTNVVGQGGQLEIPDNGVGLTLINVEEEKILKSQNYFKTNVKGAIISSNPSLKLNLYVLIAANSKGDNYGEGLKKLSYVINFFQSRNTFDHASFPSLDDSIEKLSVDLFSLPFEQQNQLWASLGAKYIPSVVYKIRAVLVEDERITLGAPIKSIDAQLESIE